MHASLEEVLGQATANRQCRQCNNFTTELASCPFEEAALTVCAHAPLALFSDCDSVPRRAPGAAAVTGVHPQDSLEGQARHRPGVAVQKGTRHVSLSSFHRCSRGHNQAVVVVVVVETDSIALKQEVTSTTWTWCVQVNALLAQALTLNKAQVKGPLSWRTRLMIWLALRVSPSPPFKSPLSPNICEAPQCCVTCCSSTCCSVTLYRGRGLCLLFQSLHVVLHRERIHSAVTLHQ